MKNLIATVLLVCIAQLSFGQTQVEKIVIIKQGQQVFFDFKWPELITFKSWAGNEIKLVAMVDINKGQNDDSFAFVVDDSEGTLRIESLIKDYKSLPKKIVIMKDGQEYFFNTDDTKSEEVRQFKEEHGTANYNYMNFGVIMDISIEVWVPKNISIDVYSKFGIVEVKGLVNSMKVHSKFGGIDISTNGNQPITAGTKFGEKYTNLDKSITSISLGNQPGKWDWIKLGNTTSFEQELKSEFGNIYIRKE